MEANTTEHFLQFKLKFVVHTSINEWVYEVIAYVEGTKKHYKADQVWVSSRNIYTKYFSKTSTTNVGIKQIADAIVMTMKITIIHGLGSLKRTCRVTSSRSTVGF